MRFYIISFSKHCFYRYYSLKVGGIAGEGLARFRAVTYIYGTHTHAKKKKKRKRFSVVILLHMWHLEQFFV